MDGFPYQCLPGRIEQRRKGLILRAIKTPQIRYGGHYGDVGKHVALLKDGSQPRFIIRKPPDIRPPGVPLVKKRSIPDPTRKWRIWWRIIEPMKYRMGNTRND